MPYNEIITTGKHKADSVKVSEDAKAAENYQRDLDIALINELVLIFNRMGIDIETVLNTAGSKWNFMPFRTGLVDGYCIGIDPFNQSTKLRLQVIIKRLS